MSATGEEKPRGVGIVCTTTRPRAAIIKIGRPRAIVRDNGDGKEETQKATALPTMRRRGRGRLWTGDRDVTIRGRA
jgi:hypothetical protein